MSKNLFLILFIFISCSQKENNESFSLSENDSIYMKSNDSVLFLPGYKYVHSNYFIYNNTRPPFTTHLYNKNGQLETIFPGNGAERNDLPFHVNLIIPNTNSIYFLTGALMHIVEYDFNGIQIKKKAVTDSTGYPVFSDFRISNDTHIGYSLDSLFIVPLENNKVDHYEDQYYKTPTIGLISNNGILLNAFGERPSVYGEKKLPYRDLANLALDSENRLIYNAYAASEKIKMYDFEGNLINEFGEKGRAIQNHEFNSMDRNQEGQWVENWQSTAIYNSMFFDQNRKFLYRIYAVDTERSKLDELGNFYNKKAYLQVYKDQKLLGEISMPQKYSWVIHDIDEDGNLIFSNKYYFDGPEDQDIVFYKTELVF